MGGKHRNNRKQTKDKQGGYHGLSEDNNFIKENQENKGGHQQIQNYEEFDNPEVEKYKIESAKNRYCYPEDDQNAREKQESMN